MSYTTPRSRRAVTRQLADEAGGDAANSEVLAAAAGRLLDRLSHRLSVIIGRAGVEALLRRAVKLRNPEFPFLDELFFREEGESTGDSLRRRLHGEDPDIIREVTVTLFATMAGLLVTVIGERLSWNLLREAWPQALESGTEPQEAEE